MHFQQRAQLVQPLRQMAKLTTLNEMRNGLPPFGVPVHVTFQPTQKPGVLADTANHLPAAKAALDGVVDAGLVKDDTPEWVLSQTFLPPVKDKATGITIMIETP
jgi:hypothetical protein